MRRQEHRLGRAEGPRDDGPDADERDDDDGQRERPVPHGAQHERPGEGDERRADGRDLDDDDLVRRHPATGS